MKKETLEEAAVRLVKETTLYGNQEASIGSSARSYFETELRCVLIGMKYQQERMYTEDEVIDLLRKAHFVDQNIDEWFEQFKTR